MKPSPLWVFVAMCVVLGLGLLIEVANPHSFLGESGALVRGGALLAFIYPWLRISREGNDDLRLAGVVLLCLGAALYLGYGLM